MEQNYYNDLSKLEDNLEFDFKKLFLIVLSRKFLVLKVFSTVLVFFILLTFISHKKWNVVADLYIKRSNNSNIAEINPYAIEDLSEIPTMIANANPLANELELMQSPLVIDKVIQENNLRFKKLFGIFSTVKTGEYLTTEKFLKKKSLKVENKKGTNVVTISYKSKDRDEAYNVVASIITNYIELHKELNSEKSKSDKKIIESEYQKAKADLDKKVSAASGLPINSMTGTGNLAAMSAFSRSAQNAMSTLRGQYLEGEKARVGITEDASKVTQLAQKLEWARLVEEMSDSSKVLVIKEPYPLRDWEYASPKLFTNILLGIAFGAIFSLMVVIYIEKTDKRLSYSMLGDNIIYNLESDFDTLSAKIVANSDKKLGFIFFEQIPQAICEKFKAFTNAVPIKADISNSLKDSLNGIDKIISFASIGRTSSKKYKLIKEIISDLNKEILYEVLV